MPTFLPDLKVQVSELLTSVRRLWIAIDRNRIPASVVVGTPRTTAPAGWLMCNGAVISRTIYAPLFSAIGTTFGAGDGWSTFNIPNMQGKVIVGVDTTQVEFYTLGITGGEKAHLLSAAETGYPDHTHVIRGGSNAIAGGTGDSFARSNQVGDGNFRSGGTASSSVYGSAGIANAAASLTHNNLQPYVALNYIIKT